VRPWGDPDMIKPSAEIVQCNTQVAAESIPFGAVTSGEIWIRGCMRQVQFTDRHVWRAWRTWTIVDENPSTQPSIGYEGAEFYFDDASEMKVLGGESGVLTAWCLNLGKVVTINHGGVKVYCLVLVKSDTSPDCYRRVGLYRAAKVPEFQPNWFEGEQVVVKIV
jgi:hypothetical protein